MESDSCTSGDGNLEKVGEVSEAVKAAEAGVDAVICQGFEAGGHIISRVRHNPTANSLHLEFVHLN